MSRKSRLTIANSLIGLVALTGGVGLTNHFIPSANATSTPTSSTAASTPAKTGKSGTATSDSVPYQFGTVQLTVTETNGKITAIDTGSSSATNGREQAFPYLVQDALKAQGSNFGNLSGATYTTDAFKQALASALSKIV